LIYRFEDYALDLKGQELRHRGVRVEVEPQVFNLLAHIIAHRDRIVSKDDLIAHVWRGRIVSDSALTSRITAARQAIGDDGGQQRLIRTISRKGIRFVGEVADEMVASALPNRPSIAVLPFENMTSDAEQQYFADGIAEDIITTLSRFPSLFVIARTSSFAMRGAEARRVGQNLGVRYVLEGSLRQAGQRLRITAQLIDAATGIQLWGERYDRDTADLFAVQDEIAKAASAAIAPAIADTEQRIALRKAPASLDAWGAYQRGMWHLAQGTEAENALAQGFFQRATELDPLFAGGFVGLSTVLSRTKGTQPEEQAMARRAVVLDPGNAEAQARLALALLAGGEHTSALAHAQQALSLSPNLAAGHGALGVILAYSGRPTEGAAALEACLRLDPRGPTLVNRLNQLAIARFFEGSFQAAADAAERAIRAFPHFPSPYRWLAAALGELGRISEAQAALQQAISLSPQEADFQIRNRPPWFTAEDHARMLRALAKAGWSE